jgi:hypothetical protein
LPTARLYGKAVIETLDERIGDFATIENPARATHAFTGKYYRIYLSFVSPRSRIPDGQGSPARCRISQAPFCCARMVEAIFAAQDGLRFYTSSHVNFVTIGAGSQCNLTSLSIDEGRLDEANRSVKLTGIHGQA